MTTGFEVVLRLTSGTPLSPEELDRVMTDFARNLGWDPSDRVNPDSPQDVTNGHLVVEHGLEQSAVITFLRSPFSQASLQPEENNKILALSYNNLIDWHIYVERDRVTYVFNRNPKNSISRPLSQSDYDAVKSKVFDQITGKSPNPNFPALDDALVNNVSYWKRNLAAELDGKPKLSDYSSLFNAIILARAAEDHDRKVHRTTSQALIDEFHTGNEQDNTLRNILERVIRKFVKGDIPKALFDATNLLVFDKLSSRNVYNLLASFYKSSDVPYNYDFAVMSKHALSRIYEHYVSILRFEEQSQLSLLPVLPKEQSTKSYGSVYTPQFIARFFSRFIREQKVPSEFRAIRTLDPACGSGIFLRTMLELQCMPPSDGISSQELNSMFSNSYGMDLDENAAQSARLSLSLLYLVLTGNQLPNTLNIEAIDAVKKWGKQKNLTETFDVVTANPPFVSFDLQSEATRKTIEESLGELVFGKADNYLPFLKIAVEALKPGGYGLFVLPHTFLTKDGDRKVREYIAQNTWIRTLIDLSAIPVFKDKGAYVILLVFQKKPSSSVGIMEGMDAVIVECQDFVGHALQEFFAFLRQLESVNGPRNIENDFYSIYRVPQQSFAAKDWKFAPPAQASVRDKILKFEPLRDFVQARQGIITGADSIFIVPKSRVPKGEMQVWPLLLRDRDMQRYSVPRSSQYHVFYPYLDGHKLDEAQLKKVFPETWDYLSENRGALKQRKSFIAGRCKWWELHSPGNPNDLVRQKIITPHLVLLPKFSLDQEGKYMISHSPYLISKEDGSEDELLKFFTVILNSTVGSWLISTHSDKYSRGYARLEVKTLSSIPVPNPSKLRPSKLKKLLTLVDMQIAGTVDTNLNQEIDELVADMYGLSHDEQLVIGFEGYHAAD